MERRITLSYYLFLCSWNSPASSAGNTGFYLARSVSAKQSGPKTGWLQNLGTDTGTCEHRATTSPWHQQLEAAPHWHMIKQIIKRTKTISFQSQHTTQSALFRATNSLRRKYVVSCHFGRSCLKANKVSKSEGIRKFEYACHFWKCADAVFEKPSEFVHACQNYSLPKLACFLTHSVHFLRFATIRADSDEIYAS